MKKAGLSLPPVAPVCHCSGLAVDEIIFQKKALKAVARPLRGPAPPLTIQYLPGGVPLCSFFSGGRLPLRMAPPTLACGGKRPQWWDQELQKSGRPAGRPARGAGGPRSGGCKLCPEKEMVQRDSC